MTCHACARHAAEVARLTAAIAVVTTGAAAAAENYRDRIHRLEAELAARRATGKRTRTRRSGVRPWAVAG
ncbi:hypothetical protein D5S18_18475 [Nocardia panacis]|uniref:Uncharacterized protein n=1 Tax=Nocardia panacis TaxID=2340916 RepID=A0A3A4K8V6_9NOCA|nr:hypothetical protein [Nocardia panacis]RJO74139.1 hypothetical protein D5S18_18475 [Nocardia panacis]